MLTIHLAAHLSDLCAVYEAISSPQKGQLLGLSLPFQAAGTQGSGGSLPSVLTW